MTKYQRNLLQVRQIVNEADPLSLVAHGAPIDEYEAEIKKMLPLLEENLDIELLASRITEIFSCSFDLPSQPVPDVFKKIAEKIIVLRREV